MVNVDAPLWKGDDEREDRIVSKCGLYCDTCPAFQNGLCNGCPRLGMGDCVVRDCAHLKQIGTCHECELDSCYHFEAYTARRKLMRERTKAFLAQEKRAYGGDTIGGGCSSGGGCGSGGCGSGGGCSGCSSAAGGGCGAVKMLEALEKAAL